MLHELELPGACVVMAQTGCLLGVVAILEISAGSSEQRNGQTRGEIVGSPHPSEEPAADGRSGVGAGIPAG